MLRGHDNIIQNDPANALFIMWATVILYLLCGIAAQCNRLKEKVENDVENTTVVDFGTPYPVQFVHHRKSPIATH